MEGACKKAGVTGKRGGTYVCMEGPQFSTKAESNVYRSWGMDVIGMTNLQEAKLAREAEICYVTVAMVTDYDCWHPHHDSVTVDQIVAVLLKNAENATRVVRETVAAMPTARACKCGSALAHAILTERDKDSRGHPSETETDSRQIPESQKSMSILAVGSVAFDTIATPSGRVEDVLGGSATYFALAASYFTEVRVVAVVGDDFTAEHENVLKKRSVDTRGIEHAKGKTFRWGGQYHDNLNEAKTDFTELNVFEQFQPRIPAEYQDSKFLFLATFIPSCRRRCGGT